MIVETAADTGFFLRNQKTNAVITGGTQGLGLAIATRLAKEGAPNIAIAGRDGKKGEAAASTVRALGCNCIYIAADVSRVEDCRRLMDTAFEKFGLVNALVNSAAITTRGRLIETDLDLWEAHMNTNLRGPFLLSKHLVGQLLEKGEPGSIVNILSMAGYCGQSFLTAYAVSKGALATLTRNIANAYRSNRIRCNGLQVGWMDTPGEHVIQQQFHGGGEDWLARAESRQPMGQLVKPDQLSSLVAYLLSPESGVMTGSIVDYDQNIAGAYPE